MDQSLINRYQPGGDIYATLVSQYGQSGANLIAQAAQSGDETQVNAAIVRVKDGGFADDSLLDALGNQLYNDPLGAPLDQAGTIISNTVTAAGNAAKNAVGAAFGNWGAWIIGGVIVIGLFLYFGGTDFFRRRIAKLT